MTRTPRLIVLLFAQGLVTNSPAQQYSPAQHSPDWNEIVVRDALVPRPWELGDEASHTFAHPIGDPGGDGYDDFFFAGFNLPPTSSSRDPRIVWNLKPHPMVGVLDKVHLPDLADVRYQSSARPITLASISTPSGSVRIVVQYQCPQYGRYCLSAFEPETGRHIFSTPPPSGPGLQTRHFKTACSAGDVNVDGYGDIFFEGTSNPTGHFAAGVISGKDGSILWQQFFPDYNTLQPSTVFWLDDELRDLNGDAIPDCIGGYIDLSFVGHMIVFSGRDGAVLWQMDDAFPDLSPYRPGTVTPDLSGDGHPDIVSASGGSSLAGGLGSVSAVSGLDGTILWSFSRDRLSQLAADHWGSGTFVDFDTPVWSNPAGPYSTKHNVFVSAQVRGNFPTRDRLRVALEFDGRTGDFLGFREYPATLFPWANEPLQHLDAPIWSENLFVLGDIDGDGLDELGLTVLEQQATPYFNSYLAILGQRTWQLPEEVASGEAVHADLWIPSSPGLPFFVAASTVFDPVHGLPIGGWRSDLAASPTYAWSTTRPLVGQLDMEGYTTVQFRTPASSSFIGTTLYTQPIVVDPLKPNRTKTVGSLGQTLIR